MLHPLSPLTPYGFFFFFNVQDLTLTPINVISLTSTQVYLHAVVIVAFIRLLTTFITRTTTISLSPSLLLLKRPATSLVALGVIELPSTTIE
jgi:hypothetical protein